MALGATVRDIVWLVMGQAVRSTTIGLALGIVAALAAGRWVSTMLYGVSPADTVTLAGTCVLCSGVALAASYWPARRAAAVDPATALRSD